MYSLILAAVHLAYIRYLRAAIMTGRHHYISACGLYLVKFNPSIGPAFLDKS